MLDTFCNKVRERIELVRAHAAVDTGAEDIGGSSLEPSEAGGGPLMPSLAHAC
jgi:hypothetical protein